MQENIEETKFMIYRDGHLDKSWYYRKQAERFVRATGRLVFIALETTLEALDEFVQSAQ